MKHITSNKYISKISRAHYSGVHDICDLNRACIFQDQNMDCRSCVLNSKMSKSEFIRITENRTKVVTSQEVQESINILVLMG
jgi:hypothetical protein